MESNKKNFNWTKNKKKLLFFCMSQLCTPLTPKQLKLCLPCKQFFKNEFQNKQIDICIIKIGSTISFFLSILMITPIFPFQPIISKRGGAKTSKNYRDLQHVPWDTNGLDKFYLSFHKETQLTDAYGRVIPLYNQRIFLQSYKNYAKAILIRHKLILKTDFDM